MIRVYVFPGQGSQRKGMGAQLFDAFPELTAQADDILGYSIEALCLNGPDQQLRDTRYTQPALFVVNALTYLHTLGQDPAVPDYLAGHSLGEYNALYAAGVFDFATGLRLVQKRGELMSQAPSGAMAAILNCDEATVQRTLRQNRLDGIDIANFNAPSQLVLAGLRDDILKAQALFDSGTVKYIPLNVGAAFHSRYMQSAMEAFGRFLQDFAFAPPKIPVISNVHARPYRPEQLKTNLAEQICRPVRWTESIRYLMGKGEPRFAELGPGNVLTRLIADIQRTATPLLVEDEPPVDRASHANGSPVTMPLVQAPQDDLPQAAQATVGDEVAAPMAPPLTDHHYAPARHLPQITPERLGSEEFKRDYGLRYAYVSGAMYKGIASKDIVVRMGKAGFLGFYGTGGVPLPAIEHNIRAIQHELSDGEPYGMNLLCNPMRPQTEMETVDLFLRYGIHNVEASAYMQVTPALVKYRLSGLDRDAHGTLTIANRVLAKVSRPEVAQLFLSPAPDRIVKQLLEQRQITPDQAAWAQTVSLADDLCVEADSGGHTDMGVASVLVPTIIRLRDRLQEQHRYARQVRVGAAGGIGTPEAAACAFLLGADFVLTGSINQCTVEAGMSAVVKDMLQEINVQDTDYAPAGDMFELGAKIQVMKRGVFFPARANKLYNLWREHDSLASIDAQTAKHIQEKYFRRSFEEVYAETSDHYLSIMPLEIDKAERSPKHKMALVFRWYFIHTMHLALNGELERRVDFQVHCGPALGAFNQWVKGTELEDWRRRHPEDIGEHLMQATADLLNRRFQAFQAFSLPSLSPR
jgi:trans-AT polyketide synthase/acyltransferase/oxidoreductase domain-containing protein